MQGLTITSALPVLPDGGGSLSAVPGAGTGAEGAAGNASGPFGAVLAAQLRGLLPGQKPVEDAAALLGGESLLAGDAGRSPLSGNRLHTDETLLDTATGLAADAGLATDAGLVVAAPAQDLAGALAAILQQMMGVAAAPRGDAGPDAQGEGDSLAGLGMGRGRPGPDGGPGSAPAAILADAGQVLPQGVADETATLADFGASLALSLESASTQVPQTGLPATASVASNPAPVVQSLVAPRFGAPEWEGALGQRVVWMAGLQHQVAELQLNPPHLGPLEVRLNLSDGQASVSFVSQQPAVREAIETALPRLREMLADNGISLGNVMVGAESFAQQREQAQAKPGNGPHDRDVSADAAATLAGISGSPARRGHGLLDLFA